MFFICKYLEKILHQMININKMFQNLHQMINIKKIIKQIHFTLHK